MLTLNIADDELAMVLRGLADAWGQSIEQTAAALLRHGVDTAANELMCRICGCTERMACVDGNGDRCCWAEPSLCSYCAVALQPASRLILPEGFCK